MGQAVWKLEARSAGEMGSSGITVELFCKSPKVLNTSSHPMAPPTYTPSCEQRLKKGEDWTKWEGEGVE